MNLVGYIVRSLLFAVISLTVLAFGPAKTKASSPDVYFYEIAVSGTTSYDKWIVMKNTGSAINFDTDERWIYKNDDIPLFKLTGNVEEGGYFLISRYDMDKSVLNVKPDQMSDKLSFDKSKLKLTLIKIVDGQQVIVDTAGNGKSPLAGSSTPNASMVRVSSESDGTLKESWFTNQNRTNLDDGASDFGTPKIGVPYASIDGWKDYAANGIDFNVAVFVAHPDETATLSVFENGVNIASGLSPGEDKNVALQCHDVGDQSISISITDNANMSYSMSGDLYCYQFADLEINEVMPAPKSGEKEWIEIYNPSLDVINLKNWQLADTSLISKSKYIRIDDDLIVPARGYLILYDDQFNGIDLNNTGDAISLSSPEGDEASVVSWDDSLSALTYAKFGTKYNWTSIPTPGKANIYKQVLSGDDEVARPEKIPDIKTGDAPKNINKWITVEGEIVENSGNTFYIDDGSGRIKVYIQESTGIDKPSMHKGDIFRITGIMNIYRSGDEPRLLPKDLSDIELIQSSEEDEGDDASDGMSSTAGKISGAGKSKAVKAVITTKKKLNTPQLLAAAIKPFSLPKLPTRISFNEISPGSPVTSSGVTVAELTIGGVGLIAIAKMVKVVLELWL